MTEDDFPSNRDSNSPARHQLKPEHTDSKRLRKERDIARELRKSGWWKNLISAGQCHYCLKKFKPEELTMDHIVPLARGGRSVQSNLVPACRPCNQKKKLDTPLDDLFQQLENERKNRAE